MASLTSIASVTRQTRSPGTSHSTEKLRFQRATGNSRCFSSNWSPSVFRVFQQRSCVKQIRRRFTSSSRDVARWSRTATFGNCQVNQPIRDKGSKRNARGFRRSWLNSTQRTRFQFSRCRVFSLVYPRPRLYERLSVLIFGRHTACARFAHRTRTRFTDQLSLELC